MIGMKPSSSLTITGRLSLPQSTAPETLRLQKRFLEAAKLRLNGNLPEAAIILKEVLAARPRHADALHLLGMIAYQQRSYEEARTLMSEAAALHPTAKVHSNLALALNKLGEYEQALACCDKAIALAPNYAVAHCNRGMILQSMRRPDEAIASFDESIRIKPNYAEPHINKSLALLRQGRFSEGWKLYEWRWEGPEQRRHRRNLARPLWLGQQELKGKTVLLHAEQGLGDTLQFCRYAALVAQLGARVLLQVERPLVRLLRSLAGVDQLLAKDAALPPFDYHCPLLSLPLAFGTRLESIPAHPSYLAADPEKLHQWANELGAANGLRVGLAWSGNAAHVNDRNRSLPLARLMQHLPAGVNYVSLQQDVRSADQAALDANGIRHFGKMLRDFSDTAALCQLMDVVISVDTSVAHLSGALGKPTWILLPFNSDWRWLLERRDSPWYPSSRLYRQEPGGRWSETLAELGNDLQRMTPLRQDTPPMRSPS